MNEVIEISDVSIRQDDQGRFSLNDLHRASGGEKRNQPSDWLRIQQTQDLVAELQIQIPGNPGIQAKQGLGTFVCKELVYAYAMWVSPAFHLKVIRAYDQMQSRPTTLSRLEVLQIAMESEQARIKAETERDHAIATKAQIGSNREATAMATASVATRRADRLAIELDQSKQYATVKRMEMHHYGVKFNWRILKHASQEMGIPAIDVFDPNFGTVKAYHSDVWREAFALDIPEAS